VVGIPSTVPVTAPSVTAKWNVTGTFVPSKSKAPFQVPFASAAFAAGSIARKATNPIMRNKFLMHTSKPNEFTMLVLGNHVVSGTRRQWPRVIL
jgi:hypothetical protein